MGASDEIHTWVASPPGENLCYTRTLDSLDTVTWRGITAHTPVAQSAPATTLT
jgi:hypothetical protein